MFTSYVEVPEVNSGPLAKYLLNLCNSFIDAIREVSLECVRAFVSPPPRHLPLHLLARFASLQCICDNALRQDNG